MLFSGPRSRPDRLARFLIDRGCVVDEVDWVNDKRREDLCDDSVWAPIEEDLRTGHYEAAQAVAQKWAAAGGTTAKADPV